MPVYTPPALNAVDFELIVQPAHSVAPYEMALSVYTVPALNAVDFALVTYTQPVYSTIDFELGAVSVTLTPGTGLLVLTGYAPTVTVSSSSADPTNRHATPNNYFRSGTFRSLGQRIKVIQSFEA